jgi:hypothetical protein
MKKVVLFSVLTCALTLHAEFEDTFPASSASTWTFTASENCDVSTRFGARIAFEGEDRSGLNMQFAERKLSRKVKGKWFTMTRGIEAGVLKDAQGLFVELSPAKKCNWWMQVIIYTRDGSSYSKELIPYHYQGNRWQNRIVDFADFKTEKKDAPPLDPARISRIAINGSVPGDTLYVSRLAAWTPEQVTKPLLFSVNNSSHNIFQPGETLQLNFKASRGQPSNSAGLRCVITDFFDKAVFEKVLQPDGSAFNTEWLPELPGYYDVKAYWLGANGKPLEEDSAIQTTGSLEQGRGTLAVVPRTIEYNRKRMKRVGADAFFGFHGPGAELSDLLGATWRLSNQKWPTYEEKAPPKMVDGAASWVKERFRGYAPDWTQNIVNTQINHYDKFPKWARKEEPEGATSLKDDRYFWDFFGNLIKLNKLRFPHMKQRIYDPMWEVNLNHPEAACAKPDYVAEDIVRLYADARKVVDAEDPGAWLVGPNCSSPIKNFDWNEPVFKAGLFTYVDAYNCHGYHPPPPEEAQVREKIRSLKTMIKTYNNGQLVPLICTELGYRSQYGAEDKHRDHARWHARVAVILKGEGFKTYYPFYSYDFIKRDWSWGINYNLDKNLTYGSKRISPKAAVPALAVCIDQLEGTVPVTDIPFFNHDVWCYVFRETASDKPVIVLWSVNYNHKISFPAGNVKTLQMTNIMGHKSTVPVKNGMAQLDVTPDPLYIRGADATIYAHCGKISDSVIASVYPGESVDVAVEELKPGEIKGYGAVDLDRLANGNIRITSALDASNGPVPILLPEHTSPVWVTVKEPLQITGFELTGDRSNKPALLLSIANHGITPVMVEAAINAGAKGKEAFSRRINARSVESLMMPLQIAGKIDPDDAVDAEASVTSGALSALNTSRKFTFLAAHRLDHETGPALPNTVNWSGKGASGKQDSASATFTYDKDNVYVNIQVKDDTFHQEKSDSVVWRMDSVQIAFDTHPYTRELYDPLAGIFTKKVTSLNFAKTPNGMLAIRHHTHNQEQLSTGDVTDQFRMDISRDNDKSVTDYRLTIPWRQIGLETVETGQCVGISLLINDSDGDGTTRQKYGFCDGISSGLNHHEFGVITLQ